MRKRWLLWKWSVALPHIMAAKHLAWIWNEEITLLSTPDAVVSLQRLRSHKIVTFKVAVLMYKAVWPTWIRANLPVSTGSYCWSTRTSFLPLCTDQSSAVFVKLCTDGGWAFLVSGSATDILNDLSNIVISAPSLVLTFRQRLKTCLFSIWH